MKPKVYISGPITGCQLWQVRKQFSHAEQLLQQAGYRTCNPLKMHLCVWLATAFVGTCIERLGYRACLALQLVWLALTCKHIYMLPNWQNSRGASAEYHVAAAFDVKPFDPSTGSGTAKETETARPSTSSGTAVWPFDRLRDRKGDRDRRDRAPFDKLRDRTLRPFDRAQGPQAQGPPYTPIATGRGVLCETTARAMFADCLLPITTPIAKVSTTISTTAPAKPASCLNLFNTTIFLEHISIH